MSWRRGLAVHFDVAVGVPAAAVGTVGIAGDVVSGGSTGSPVALSDNDLRERNRYEIMRFIGVYKSAF